MNEFISLFWNFTLSLMLLAIVLGAIIAVGVILERIMRKMEDKMTVKTREEIESLKSSWHSDPCWDIEKTEGFEAHEEELRVYSDKCKQDWAEQHFNRRLTKSTEMGCSGNLKLVDYLEKLEARISKLESHIIMIDG